MRPSRNPDEWKKWNRWDVPGHRTIYAASSSQTAYAEVLDWFKRKIGSNGLPDLHDYVDDLDADDVDGWLSVEREFQRNGTVKPGYLPAAWREDRRRYLLRTPVTGWFVDITAAETMAAVRAAMRPDLALLGVADVDLSLLTSDARDVTCAIAGWVHGLVLDDGSRPHGIVYSSRHGVTGESGRCWATWLRKIDEGEKAATEPTKAHNGARIEKGDQDLQYVLKLFGIKTH